MLELTGLIWCCTCSWGREDMLCSPEENDRFQYPTWKIILWSIKTGLYIILCSLSEANGAIISVIVTCAQEFFYCKYELHSLCTLTASQFNRNWSLTTFRCTVSRSDYIFYCPCLKLRIRSEMCEPECSEFQKAIFGHWPYFFYVNWTLGDTWAHSAYTHWKSPYSPAGRADSRDQLRHHLFPLHLPLWNEQIQTVLCFVV